MLRADKKEVFIVNKKTEVSVLVNRLKKQGVEQIEFIYTDYTGLSRGKTVFINELSSRLLDGVGITRAMPASTARDEIVNVPGMNAVGEYRLVPDLESLRILPYAPQVATVMCDYYDEQKKPLAFDPRVILQEIIKQFKKFGLEAKMTYENEFILYKEDPETELKPDNPKICFSTEAMDHAYRFLPELVKKLRAVGIYPVEYYPEAGAGQHEIPVAPSTPLNAADNELRFKRIVKRVVQDYGLYATFAPKPNLETAGTGAHIHLSLWKGEKNVFFEESDALQLSKTGYYFIGGLMKHMRALLAFTCPTVNSYQRLQPGHWSSAYATFGKDNREAAVRIPSTFWSEQASSMNIELKASDATANPYLAFAAILAAGLDGIKNKILPNTFVDEDPATMTKEQRTKLNIKRLPLDLETALVALEEDSYFRTIFTDVGVDTYCKVKRADIRYFKNMSAVQIAAVHRDLY
ncbi:glutamine synthetase [Liquorilactobacillus oeni DSM 19972]|uniref:Glutamine synthetase n=1 Tax=Liquorilactobacillus oeni DSM 19972 TaxID=1423777 RepID=A0A0R1MIY4_9LACO|nr:glutamine synthetase [Liquorilactobacillus oeni DSM 19972]